MYSWLYGKRLLIDGDVISHSIASANTDKLDEETVIYNYEDAKEDLRETREILHELFRPSEVLYCFSGERLKNFRMEVYPAYKGNRDYSQGRNPLQVAIESDIMNTDGFLVEERLEADDLLGLLNRPYKDIIVSIDKDLDTLEGWHFNPRKDKVYKTDESYSTYFLWSQILSGDPVDNYHGLSGIGTETAMDYLLDWEENYIKFNSDMDFDRYIWEHIVELYEDYGFTEEGAICQARCAYILHPGDYNFETKEIKLWQPPSP